MNIPSGCRHLQRLRSECNIESMASISIAPASPITIFSGQARSHPVTSMFRFAKYSVFACPAKMTTNSEMTGIMMRNIRRSQDMGSHLFDTPLRCDLIDSES